MADVKVIKANVSILERNKGDSLNRLKVAAYARVSTGSEEQLSSYEAQLKYYKELIDSKPEWKMVDVYADEAITGTKVDKRVNFIRMLNDAFDGKIDMILTKSISRFARNTVDTLKYVRQLKEKNVAVLFEEENINTLSMDGELLLTILSSVAQQEVQNISEHVKLGLKMRMQKGQLIGFNRCLGYDYHKEDKTITVNEKEAEIIRYIFNRYIQGAGANVICKELDELGYKSSNTKKNRWNPSTIIGIIKNEKYVGDILQGKTFTLDPISKRRLSNLGESDQFYIKDNHEPIVTREIFEKANEILKERSCPRRWGNQYNRELIPKKYAFSSMCECGFCHSNLTRRNINIGSPNEKRVWQCANSVKNGKTNCKKGLQISEDLLEKAFVESLKIVADENNDTLLESFIQLIENTLNSTSPNEKIKHVEKDLKDLVDRKDKILDLRLSGIVSKEECEEKYQKISNEIEIKEDELNRLNDLNKSQKAIKERMTNFKKIILENGFVESFDRETLETLVEKVIVGGKNNSGEVDSHQINFVFKSGDIETPLPKNYSNNEYISFYEFNLPYKYFYFKIRDDGTKEKIMKQEVTVILSISMK